MLPKILHRFNAIPNKKPTAFFPELENKRNSAMCMEPEETWNSKPALITRAK